MSKTLLITGGTSPIGTAIVRRFAGAGYDIFFTFHSKDFEAENLVYEIKSQNRECLSFKQDLSDPHAPAKIMAAFEKHYSHIDVLINNAVVKPSRRPVLSLHDEEIDKQIMIGFNSAIKLCKHASGIMKSGSSIINLSSEAAKFGGNRISVYAAIKGALNSFTIGYAREMAEFGIRVNAISPAVISNNEDSEEDQTIPIGRKGKPSEVADLAYFLSSKHASYISGSIVTVSGAR